MERTLIANLVQWKEKQGAQASDIFINLRPELNTGLHNQITAQNGRKLSL